MADTNISIGVILDQFKADMAQIPGIGEREARDMVSGIRKELRKVDKATKDTAKAVSTGFSGEFNKIASASGAMAEKLGGNFAMIGSLANSALKPLAEVGGAVGVIGAGAIGAALLAGALYKTASGAVALADAAGAAGERLHELRLLTDDEILSTREFAAITKATDIAQDRLTVRLGEATETVGGLQAAWAGINITLAGAAGVFSDAVEGVHDFRTAAFDTIPVLGDLWMEVDRLVGPGSQNLGLNPVVNAILREMRDTAQEATLETDKARLAVIKLMKADAESSGPKSTTGNVYADSNEDLTEHLNLQERLAEQDVAEGERQAALAKQREANAAKAKAAADKLYAAKVDIFDLDDKIDAAMAAEAKAIQEAADASREFDDVLRDTGVRAEWAGSIINNMISEEAAAAQKERLNAIRDAVLSLANDVAGAFGAIFDELASRHEDALERTKEANASLLEDQRSLSGHIIALQREASKETDAAAKKRIEAQIEELEGDRDAKQEKLEAGRELAAEQRAAARRAFAGSKAAAVLGIGIQTALGVMNAMATVPWPAAPIVAAGVGIMGATQAGIAASQKMPEFPMGLSPDHGQIVAVQPGEPVLPKRAAKDLGADGVRRLQEGRGGGGGDVTVQISGRDVMRATAGGGRVRCDPRAGKTPRRGR